MAQRRDGHFLIGSCAARGMLFTSVRWPHMGMFNAEAGGCLRGQRGVFTDGADEGYADRAPCDPVLGNCVVWAKNLLTLSC